MASTSTEFLGLRRLPAGRRVPFATLTTALLAGASGLILGFAMPALIGGESVVDYLKAVLIAGTAALVSFGVTRLAVEKGAPQAAIGVRGAFAVSAGSILVVGLGLFAATYAGFTMRQADELRLHAFGTQLAVHVDWRIRDAWESARVVPVLDSIVDDLAAKEACERQASCLSGHGAGGVGPVTRALVEKRQRADAVLAQVAEGEAVRARAAERLSQLLIRYREVLDDPEAGNVERRKGLQTVLAEIGRQTSALDEAMPIAMLQAYAMELRSPVAIPDRREASAKVTGLLTGYAESLGTVLSAITPERRPAPVFPGRTGVSDTLTHIGHFLPIAAIVAAIELIFPMALWLYTFFSLQVRVAEAERRTDADIHDSAGDATQPAADAAEPARRPRRKSA